MRVVKKIPLQPEGVNGMNSNIFFEDNQSESFIKGYEKPKVSGHRALIFGTRF